MDIIKIEEVVKSFGRLKAVDRLSLQVREGEIFGFLGANGAGKTTVIKMLLGLCTPDLGKVEIFGNNPVEPSTRTRIGFMPESAYYYHFLTLRELLCFYGGLSGMSSSAVRKKARDLIERTGLAKAQNRTLRTFSKGMLQRAGIIQALLHDPSLLILDEPFTGLDPLARINLRNLLKELRNQGKTIFFSSHELSEAELICDRIAIMRKGQLVLCDSLATVVGDSGRNLERIFLQTLGVNISTSDPDSDTDTDTDSDSDVDTNTDTAKEVASESTLPD